MGGSAAPWQAQALARSHDRDDFDCGAEPLDRYLKQRARQDAARHVAAPFVLVAPPSPRVLGYYTLSASIVGVGELPDVVARRLRRYPLLPVTLLGRLAVDRSVRGRGAGQFLLMDALWRCLDAADEIAAMAIVVEAKDDAAAAFYRHFGFLQLQQHARRLFLPMQTVSQLFGRPDR